MALISTLTLYIRNIKFLLKKKEGGGGSPDPSDPPFPVLLITVTNIIISCNKILLELSVYQNRLQTPMQVCFSLYITRLV